MNNYCPDLFTNLFVQKHDESTAQIAFCCMSGRTPPIDKIDFFHPDLEKSRQYYLETGELPSDCQQCIDSEKNGIISRRLQELSYNRRITTDREILRLQYNCDNICNLKCIGCGGWYSSAWFEDEIKLGIRQPTDIKIKPTKNNPILLDLDIFNLEMLYFNGGEPLMTKDHINVMQYIVDNGNPGQVHVLYNTNGTHTISDEVKELWLEFQSVTLILSIDGINDSFEYIRFPASWSHVEKNVHEFYKVKDYVPSLQIKFGINVGVHNILYFNDLDLYCREKNIPLIYQHDTTGNLSLMNFPKHLIPKLQEELEKLQPSDTKDMLINCLSNIKNPNVRSWVGWLLKLDRIRGNNWKKSLNKLYDLDPEYFDRFKIF